MCFYNTQKILVFLLGAVFVTSCAAGNKQPSADGPIAEAPKDEPKNQTEKPSSDRPRVSVTLKMVKPLQITNYLSNCADEYSKEECESEGMTTISRPTIEGTVDAVITNNTDSTQEVFFSGPHNLKFENLETHTTSVLCHQCEIMTVIQRGRPPTNERIFTLAKGETKKIRVENYWSCDGGGYNDLGDAKIYEGGAFSLSYRLLPLKIFASRLRMAKRDLPKEKQGQGARSDLEVMRIMNQESFWKDAIVSEPININIPIVEKRDDA
ncbi:MAG: hypothetical protein GY854_24365 [Deltaproteobacteria bacterium]|nr:hypothetical protein [Deltaproteobacteria bacterium]